MFEDKQISKVILTLKFKPGAIPLQGSSLFYDGEESGDYLAEECYEFLCKEGTFVPNGGQSWWTNGPGLSLDLKDFLCHLLYYRAKVKERKKEKGVLEIVFKAKLPKK